MSFLKLGPERSSVGSYVEDERQRLSTFDLIGLAAGGVVGSGWLLSATDVWQKAGQNAVWAWVIGGVIMLAIAIVMVELATATPKTGGLIFLPLQSSGPLVATIVATGLWLAYALNSASEAVAMVKGLGSMNVSNLAENQAFEINKLKFKGLVFATVFLAAILAVNLLARRLFVRFNFLLTLWKILIPVLIISLMIKAGHHTGAPASCVPKNNGDCIIGFPGILTAVTSGGVVYAYLGFQGPMDFAGNVRRRGRMGEAARLRWSVYGTIVGATVLYILLQMTLLNLFDIGLDQNYAADSPYAHFATALSLGCFAPLIRVDALLSPMGSGLVYTHALTREVAALSRAHVTHRGLQIARRASLRLGPWSIDDVYWLVLLVDFMIGWLALVIFHGDWNVLASLISILELIIYTMAGIVLVAIQDRLPAGRRGRRMLLGVLSRVGFVATGLLLYWAKWPDLGWGMVALASGCVVLLGLPILARQDLPVIGRVLRRYDAHEYATMFRRDQTKAAARAAMWLAGYLLAVTLLDWLRSVFDPTPTHPNLWWEIPVNLIVAGLALLAFQLLVTFSRRYMVKVPPTLPGISS